MKKSFGQTKSFLAQVAFVASYGAQFKFKFGLIIELISSLQILSLILKTSFPSFQDREILIFDLIRNLVSSISLLSGLSSLDTEFFVVMVWVVMLVYLLGHLVFMLFIVVLCIREIRIHPRISQVFTVVNIIHSKVAFSPICFFLFSLIASEKQCELQDKYSFFCGSWVTNVTAFLLALNYAFGYLKEIYFYQTYKSQNMFSVTNNLHAFIQLTHKGLLLPLLILIEENTLANSILNVGFTLFYHEILFRKLPFYSIEYLGIAVAKSTVCLAFSLILFWKAIFESENKIFELLLMLLTPLAIKLMMRRLHYIFERILSLKSSSSIFVYHLPALMKNYIAHSNQVDLRSKVDPKTIYTYGFVKSSELDSALVNDPKSLNVFKFQKNRFLLHHFLNYYRKNLNSVDILFSLAQLYVEKIKSVTEAIIYIQKIESLLLSIPALNNLNQIKKKLQSVLLLTYSGHDESLELINYFKYREISTAFKKIIEKEASGHSEFWQILSNNKIEVNKAIEISLNLETLASTIKNMWLENEIHFMKNYPLPLIMYVTYLSIVRGIPHLGKDIINKCIGKNLKPEVFMEKWFSQEKALIVASNQKGQLGKILDVSHSIKNLFNIEKEDLIGRKINILMPSMIRERHDEFIQRYNQKPIHDFDNKLQVFCKSTNGLFFHVDLRVRVYPYIDKGSALIGILEKKGDCVPMMFVDLNGYIVDCSRELSEAFQLDLSLDKNHKIQDISPHFEAINEAFNSIYLSQAATISCIKKSPAADSQTENENTGEKTPIHKPVDTLKTTSLKTQAMYLNSEAQPMIHHQEGTANPVKRFKAFGDNGHNDINQQTAFLTTNSQDGRRVSKTRKFSSNKGNLLRLPEAEEDEDEDEDEGNTAGDFNHGVNLDETKGESQTAIKDDKMKEFKRICEDFATGSLLLFRSKAALNVNDSWTRYFVTVEHFIFDNQFYKAVTMKRINRKNRSVNTTSMTRVVLKNHSQADLSMVEGNMIGRRRMRRKDDTSLDRSQEKSTILSHIPFKKPIRNEDKQENRVGESLNRINFAKKQQVRNTDYHDNKKVKEILYNLFTRERSNTLIKIYFGLFYFTMLLVLVAAGINFSVARNSFDQIEIAVKLSNNDSQRLTSLIKLWGSVNIIYHNLVKHERPGNPMFFALIDKEINNVKQTNRDLVELLGQIDYSEIHEEFYRKDIRLWDPNNDLETLNFDVFMASNVVADKMRLVTNQSRYSWPDENLAIYVVNNTANDIVLSAEKELQVTEKTKNDIYAKHLSVLQALVFYQGFSIVIVSFSLLTFAVRILKGYKKTYRVLLTIPVQYIEVRKQQLTSFQQIIGERAESMNFIQGLNSFLEENIQSKKASDFKRIVFKEENKLHFKNLIIQGVLMLIIAFSLFLLIFGLFYLSNSLSVNNLDSLKHSDTSISLVLRLARHTYLLNGNLMCWMSFYNQDNMKLRNERLEDQLTENLKEMLTINQDLVHTFGNEEDPFYDPHVKRFLSSGLCSFLRQIFLDQTLCNIATKGDILGLLGIISQYQEQTLTYTEEYREGLPVSDISLITGYARESLPYIASLEVSSTSLLSYLLDGLLQITESQRSDSTLMFFVLFVVCVSVTFLVRVFTLEKFATFYKKRQRVLTLIPQDVLMENKAIMSYIKTEFAEDVTEIRSIL